MRVSILNRFFGYSFSQNVANNVIQQRLSNKNVNVVLTYINKYDTEITGEGTGNTKDVEKMCAKLVLKLDELIYDMWDND